MNKNEKSPKQKEIINDKEKKIITKKFSNKKFLFDNLVTLF